MTILFTEPSFVPVSGNSVVYPGAKLYFYATETSTPQNTYSEYTLTTAHANPVVADADGRFAPIYLDPRLEDYKVVLKDSSDVTIWTVDPYSAINNTTRLGTMSDLLSASTAIGTVSINGYHTAGDGGGGVFYWDASQDKANHNGGTIIDPDVTFPSDWTNQTQVAAWFTAGTGTGCWVRINGPKISAKAFGVKGDGSTNDILAINQANTFCASNSIPLSFAGCNSVVGSVIELTTAHNGLSWDMGGGTISKGFNGTLITVTGTVGFDIVGTGTIDGVNATYTGKGIVYSGGCNYPTIAKTITLLNLDGASIEFGADAGFRAKINPVIRFDSGTHTAISCTGTDTTAMFRDFSGVSANGSIDLVGTSDTTINSAFVTKVSIDSTCSITTVIGTIWGNAGGAVTIDGAVTTIIGCRLSAVVTLSSTMTGAFIANTQTSPGFTNNSIAGNVIVIHHPLGESYENWFKHNINLTPAGEFQINNFVSPGDADYTWSPNASPSILRYASTLTADRTINLTTTGTRTYTKLKIYRASGAFNLIIGTTGKSLAANEWCEVIYNGSAWEVIASGSR